MSYQVLARKWRPRTFTEMVGQEHVLRALINGLDNNRLHHAYLFTGTRGVGKTTIARILAKCLNCEAGVSSTPCGVCSSCREIAEGRFVDLIEVDAASRTKVEDTRDLLDNVQYLPTRGRYKVYLIDEVHMLTNHSFNALLKTLEEPPPHVKFLLATTDPQKLPVTVLSRCLQFNLKNLGPERIVGHLKFVLGEEKIPFEESALWELGRAADGSMRDALSLTDQAIAHGGGTLTAAEVNAMLGTLDRSAIVEICQAVASGDVSLVMSGVERLADHAPDYSGALADMLSLWHQVAIAQAMPDALSPVHEHHGAILRLAETVSREDVQLLYQITLLGRKDLPHAADPRSGFEMVLLRLLAFRPLMPDSAMAHPPTIARTEAGMQGSEVAAQTKKPEVVAGHGAVAPGPATRQATRQENRETPAFSRVETAPPAVTVPEMTAAGAKAHGKDQVRPSTSPVAALVSVMVAEPEGMSAELPRPGLSGPEMEPVPEEYAAYGDMAPPPWLEDGGPRDDIEPESPGRLLLDTMLEATPQLPSGMALPGDSLGETDLAELPEAEKIPLEALTPERWIDVCRGIGKGGLLQNLALNMVLDRVAGPSLALTLDTGSSALYEESHQHRLAALLSDYFNAPISIRIAIGDAGDGTPRRISERLRAERLQKAVESLRSDPNVRELCRVFDAELIESSVKPIDHEKRDHEKQGQEKQRGR